MSYQVQPTGAIVRLADMASIPPDVGNSDYRDFLEWLAAGNAPVPYEAPPPEIGTKITRGAFIDRIGFENWARLEYLAAERGTTKTDKLDSARIRTAQSRLEAERNVDLTLQTTIDLVNLVVSYLVAKDGMDPTEGQALITTVLDTGTITADELP